VNNYHRFNLTNHRLKEAYLEILDQSSIERSLFKKFLTNHRLKEAYLKNSHYNER